MEGNDYIVRAAYKKYLIPMVVSSVSPNFCASIDKAIVGNMLGQNELASVGLAMPITVLVSILSMLFSLGGSNICTLHNSRGEEKETNHVFTVSVLCTLGISLVLSVAGVIFLNPLVRLLGANEALFDSTRSYALVMLLGLPIMILCMSMDFFLRVDGSPNVIVVGMILANCTNIVLDIVFIRMGMGVVGAALATVAGYTLSLILYGIHIFSKKCTLRFMLAVGECLNAAKSAIYVGFGAVIQFSGWLLSIIIINKRLADIGGTASLSVYAVVLSISIFTSSTFNGVINAMTPVVGTFYGDRDYVNLRKALKRGAGVAYLLGMIMAACYWVAPGFLSRLFGVTDAATIAETSNALRLVAFGVLMQMIVNVLTAFYQVTEKAGMASIIAFTWAGILQPFLPLLLTPFLGVSGVYASLVLMEAGGLLAAGVCMFLYRCKNPKAKGFLLLDPITEGCEFMYSLKSDLESISEALGAAFSFCNENNFDKQRTYTIGIAIDELTRNIIEHGLAKEKKAHYIDIRIKLNGDQLILRIRDDGMIFNPIQVDLKKMSMEAIMDGERMHLGIGMVKGMAKKMEYTRILGFNNLVVYA